MSSPKKRSWLWNTLGLIAFAAVSVGLVGGWMMLHGKHAEADASHHEKPIEVVVVTLEPLTPRPLRRSVNVVGTLYGRDEIVISPKVEGRIVKLHHDVGDAVKPGETLLEIDPTDYELAVA